MYFKKEKKEKKDIKLSFELTLPEKLTYNQTTTLSAGYLCLKIDKIYYIAELNYGLNKPVFKKIGEPPTDEDALVIYCKSRNSTIGLPLFNISSYKALQLKHFVPVESTVNTIMLMNSPTKTRGSIVQGEHFSKQINLPEISADVLSTNSSEILIKIQLQENLDYELIFENRSNSNSYQL